MKFLLSVIALCLVMITAKLYIPEAQAEVGGMNWMQLYDDQDFEFAVEKIVKDMPIGTKNKIRRIVEDCYVDLDSYGAVYPNC